VVPAEVTLAVLEEELPPAEAGAFRHGWRLSFDQEHLVLDAHGVHPADRAPLLLTAEFDGYRALPPAWRFVDPETREATAQATPTRDPVAGKRASVIYGVGVICAHFSRTAYAEYRPGAPHSNWSLAAWDQVEEGVQAHTVAEMLAVIMHHLSYSRGRLG
jgi:hypothetical protein